MRFHGNQLSWVINYPFINLCFKYHFPGYISFSTMLAPVISSLNEIYCTVFSLISSWAAYKVEKKMLVLPSNKRPLKLENIVEKYVENMTHTEKNFHIQFGKQANKHKNC